MAWYNSLAHAVGNVVGAGAVGAGTAYDYLTPGKGSSSVTKLGKNITNPNVTLSNPAGLLASNNQAFTGTGAYGASPSTAGGSNGTSNASAVYDPSAVYGSGYGSSASGYGAGGTAQVNPEAALISSIQGKIGSIQSAYDALTGSLQSAAGDQANQVNQNYDTQNTQLGNTYKDTANQLVGQYQAHGLGDSSYAGNAQDSANQTYQTNLQSIANNRNSDLAKIGQALQQGLAQNNAGKNSLTPVWNNLGQYSDADLQNLSNQYDAQIQDLAAQQGGSGTQAQYLNTIKSVAPTQNQGTTQLQTQLQQLANSATPTFAKNTIAQGLINQAGQTDPNSQSYWANYFKTLSPGT